MSTDSSRPTDEGSPPPKGGRESEVHPKTYTPETETPVEPKGGRQGEVKPKK